ncbi:3-oxoadipate enol-lactonase [Xanthomonas sontii]|uniref:3-oxoadipate enol-lactonase n=1 Tax=Xanthomonas sontii TaxID=2650745 RepID=UPI00123E07A6|nr:3-oxoadipate enol-lactonase [Xanthomonas sontii]KAA8919595.1 3-oxoadipate enol-lactonase [Xanthomonas sontii]
MPILDLPTHRLHYRIDGSEGRPWLTLCNSLGTDLHMWDAQIAALSPHFRVLRYDRRGHGASTTPPAPYAIADLGGDVVALWDALSIERSHFCGLSIGGLTGQWLGLHAGERLLSLTLCATAAKIGSAESWQARIEQVRAEGLAPLCDGTRTRWFTPAFAEAQPATVEAILDSFRATDAQAYIGCCQALAEADFRARLGEIRVPVLAVAGHDDPVCPPADLQAIAAQVAQGEEAEVHGRHLCNVESPHAFNDALLRFLLQ